MAVSITHDLTTLYDAQSNFGGMETTDLMPPRYGATCIGQSVDRETAHFYDTVSTYSLIGQTIYVWLSAPPSAETIDNGGIRIVIGDGSDVRAYYVGGFGTRAFTSNGWQCYVLNGDNLPTMYEQVEGTAEPDLTSLTQVGCGFNVPAKAVGGAINCFTSICRVGTGLTIGGGSDAEPGVFYEIFEEDFSTQNAFGIVEEMGAGIYGIQGSLTFGDDSNDSYFIDENAVIYFHDVLVGNDFYEFNTVGSDTHINIFQLGEKLGTGGEDVVGSDGFNIINGGPGLSVNFSSNNSNGIYGSRFNGVSNGIDLGNNSEVISSIFDSSGKVIAGSSFIRDCTFSGTNDNDYTGSSLLWNDNIDIRSCTFNANIHDTNDPAAIEHPDIGTFDYNILMFSGNDIDIRNTSGGSVTINALGGSNPDEQKSTGDTTVQVSASLTLVDLQPGSRIRILEHGTENVLASTDNSGDTFEYSYNIMMDVDIAINHLDYVYWRLEGYSLTGEDASLPISQREDRVYFNP